MIDRKTSNAETHEWLMHTFMELHRVIEESELKEMYTPTDMILSATNYTKDSYTKMFQGNFGEVDKYYVTENTREYSNGDIIIGSKPVGGKSEVRHCFTTHSIQGETAKVRLFIDSNGMSDCRMIYTAISRAKRLDQIYLVKNQEPEYKYPFGKIYMITAGKKAYIGSTIKPEGRRLEEHRKDYLKWKETGQGKYCTSFELMGEPNVQIKRLEWFKCNDLKDLWKREAEVIRSYGKKVVNKTYNERSE